MKVTIDQRKRLHHLCFKDTDAYVDGFFKRIYNGSNSVDICQNEDLIATLYYKRYAYALQGRLIPYAFVSGLCVHPDYRGRGLASALIEKFLAETSDALVVLHPFDVQFYLKQGFVGVSYAQKEVADGSYSSVFTLRAASSTEQTAVLARLNQSNIASDTTAHRIWASLSDIQNQIALEEEDGSTFQFICLDNIPLGYCLRSDTEIFNYDILSVVLDKDQWIPQDLSYYRPFCGDIFNMARAANISKLLRLALYNVPESMGRVKVSFNLVDDRVPQNNGSYVVVVEDFVALGIIRASQNSSYPTITVQQLTYLATGQPEKVPEVSPDVRDRFLQFQIFDLLQY